MKVYVNTYAKYNEGIGNSVELDPEDFSDKDEFLEACQEFYGEGEHEFMFQDHEDIPARYINESLISDGLWDEFIPLDDAEREICQLYRDNTDEAETLLSEAGELKDKAANLIYVEIKELSSKLIKRSKHVLDFHMAMGGQGFSCKCNQGLNYMVTCPYESKYPEIAVIKEIVDTYNYELHITGMPLKVARDKEGKVYSATHW